MGTEYREIDVLVTGGSLEGCIAAAELAKKGKKVLLTEKSGSLGGIATNGLENVMHPEQTAERRAAEYAGILREQAGEQEGLKGPFYHDQKAKVVLARMLKEAEKGDVPVVLLDWDLYQEEFDRVLMDNKQGIYDGVDMLIKEGHRCIAFVACPEVARKGGQRKDGYVQCLKEWDIPVNQEYLYEGQFSEQSGYEACRQFFALPAPPTAVLAACSSATLGCFRYLSEHRLLLKKDIGQVGFDDSSLVEFLGYPVTALEQPVRELGECA